nr:DUF3311 domain-containing protein [Halomarina rubra]
MIRRTERLLWVVAMAVLVVFAVPWFLWRDATVVAGLPLWLWWHVGWMVLASGVFALFAHRAWGVGIESPEEAGHTEPTPGERV